MTAHDEIRKRYEDESRRLVREELTPGESGIRRLVRKGMEYGGNATLDHVLKWLDLYPNSTHVQTIRQGLLKDIRGEE